MIEAKIGGLLIDVWTKRGTRFLSIFMYIQEERKLSSQAKRLKIHLYSK